MSIFLRRVENPGAEPGLIAGLTSLLQEVVASGASVGFLASLAEAEAEAYWRGVLGALGPGLALWVAEAGTEMEGETGLEIIGTVQLAPSLKANGRHRAELNKLLVRPRAQGRGVATQLLAAAEAWARDSGLRLLVLDTERGSKAEQVYARLGWQRVGEIPDFALTAHGAPISTVYFYKQLSGPLEPGSARTV